MSRLLGLLLAALAGIAFFFVRSYRPRYNRPLIEAEPRGRRQHRPALEGDSLVWVALSGGGTRAAALAWRVLEELRGIPFPVRRQGEITVSTLADEIDFISGISGGSFAATAWCLHRDESDWFRERFLERNIQAAILGDLVLSPRRLLRLASPHYGRINVAAELYDREVFDGKTFADLPRRPELRLHSTHLALGARFSFTERDFELLGSELDSYPLGFACAASSAFPVALSPMTLLNFGETLDLDELQRRDRLYRVACREARDDVEQDYRRAGREYYNDKSNRYIHLADGGLVDNQGLQAILDGFERNEIIQRRMNDGTRPLRRLVIINVNAGTRPDDHSGRRAAAPGLKSVMIYTMVTSMDLLSAKRWVRIQHHCRRLYKPVLNEIAVPYAGMEEPYTPEISFRNLPDEALQRRCYELPTSFHLAADELALIDDVAPRLVAEDPHIQRLRASLEEEIGRLGLD